MTRSSENDSDPVVAETPRRFVLWAFEALGIELERQPEGVYAFCPPEEARDQFAGAERVRFAFGPDRSAAGAPVDGAPVPATPSSELFQWLIEQLKRRGRVMHAAPREQADSVRAITPRLFEAYRVDRGRVQLGGCRLEDRPFLRLTYRNQAGQEDSQETLVHRFFDESGRSVDRQLVASLRMDDLVPAVRRSRDLDDRTIERWTAEARRSARRWGGDPAADLIAVTVVWCKFAEGKLVFQIEKRSVELAFAGWAQFFADRRAKPPPYSCPLCRRRSYHLAATDDGRISVAEAIQTCSQSQRKVLADELETCERSGQRALPEYLETCPISGRRILQTELALCAMCRQAVDPATLRAGRCRACHTGQRIDRDEPLLTRLISHYPGLARWPRWTLAETATVYILVAKALLKQLLVVVDKRSFELRHLATGHRLARSWTEVPAPSRSVYLQ